MDETPAPAETPAETPAESERPVVPAPDFTLTDQYGQEHTLSDYQGKTVFLNFWATWCGPCQREMPDIQALYEAYGENEGDLVVLGVANPKTEENPYAQDGTVDEVEAFLTDGGYTFPVVMDTTGAVFAQYAVSAFPTTFMITAEGNVYGYVPGRHDHGHHGVRRPPDHGRRGGIKEQQGRLRQSQGASPQGEAPCQFLFRLV